MTFSQIQMRIACQNEHKEIACLLLARPSMVLDEDVSRDYAEFIEQIKRAP